MWTNFKNNMYHNKHVFYIIMDETQSLSRICVMSHVNPIIPMVEGIIECKNLHWFTFPPRYLMGIKRKWEKKIQGISKKRTPIRLGILFPETPLAHKRGNIILGKVPFDYIEKWMVVFMGLRCPPHRLENCS